jgi:hypothetical protein
MALVVASLFLAQGSEPVRPVERIRSPWPHRVIPSDIPSASSRTLSTNESLSAMVVIYGRTSARGSPTAAPSPCRARQGTLASRFTATVTLAPVRERTNGLLPSSFEAIPYRVSRLA